MKEKEREINKNKERKNKKFLPFNSIESEKSDGSNQDDGELFVVPGDLVMDMDSGMTIRE